MGLSERYKEIRRRRHRREKIAKLRQRFEKASPSEKAVLTEKIRRLTPGADEILAKLGVQDS